MDNSIVVSRPTGQATQLVLLFHGVGASAKDMAPIGEYLARALPNAMVVSVDAVQASDFGHGRQWFSVQGITETNRGQRVLEAMPAFTNSINYWQQQANVSAQHTVLIGFSQGAIMLLEATQLNQPLATKIIAIAGRFAQPPRIKPHVDKLYLLHGDQDNVIAVDYSKAATESLRRLGAEVVLDIVPNLGHGINAYVLEQIVNFLQA